MEVHALHAASYYGHAGVVQILLEAGADRSIKNRFNCLPFDEALNDQVKNLFSRIPTANRYVNNGGSIEWEMFDNDVEEKSTEERTIIETLYEKTSTEKMFENILKNYVEKGLKNVVNFEQIQHFFQRASEEKDPRWIIKAYTAESDFYKILNSEIAGGSGRFQSERRYIIALLRHHPKLDEFVYVGKSHRAVAMTSTEIERFKIDAKLMTQAFVSSSIDEKVVELLISEKETMEKQTPNTRWSNDGRNLKKIWVILIYHIKKRRTALHIENISQYPSEGEVLIMPHSVFNVKTLNKISVAFLDQNQSVTKIEVEEIDE